ncbi:MAG: PDR/VanB family oxidoreductase [Xanthobacteraceae bacterium]
MPKLRVTRIDAVTPRIRRIELENAESGELPAFTAGAHIDLDLGNGEARSYSLLNDPGEQHRYVLGVLREENGTGGSEWVHDKLKTGDQLTSTPPSNDFALDEEGGYHILIAGGIGITPIMSMAARLASLGRDYAVHYCARSQAEAAFLDELAAQHTTKLTTHFDGGNPAVGIDLKALLTQRPPAAHVYVCGPTGLIRAVREATKDWPRGTVHFELFKGSVQDTEPVSNDRPFDIILKKSNKTLNVPADKSILQVLRAEGIKVKTLCTRGTCGTCRVGLISGKVDHRDEVLDDDERESFLQVCVSRAMPGETLVLDL